MIATVTIKLHVPAYDAVKEEGIPRDKISKGENDLWGLWEQSNSEIKYQIKKWAENEFDGIAEYGGVISVKVSTAPTA